MNAHKRSAAVLTIGSVLLGAASFGATIGPGQAEQPVEDYAAIHISAITVGHTDRSTHRNRDRVHRVSDGRKATEAGLDVAQAGLDVAAVEGQPREQAAAQSTEAGEAYLVLKSLPGRNSRAADCS